MTTTAISLADLSQLTSDYLREEVNVRITEVTRNLERGDEGTFNVQITNADSSRGIRLQDVTLHLEVVSGAVVRLDPRVSALLQTRATGSRSDPLLPATQPVEAMFVFFNDGVVEPNDVMEPGEQIQFEIRYHAEGAGTTDVTAHIHATIAPEDLFPRTQGATVEKSITVRA